MGTDALQSQRDAMVDQQLAARGIKDQRVLDTMRRIPRHRFLSPEHQRQAYEDHPVPIACGQTISQPYMVAIMTELLELSPADRVLEIGTGSGYQTAILASLSAKVVSIERYSELADRARQRLADLGFTNVTVHCRDGTLGYPESAPYDAILVTAGSPSIPPALQAQLTIGGRLLCPIGGREMQTLAKVRRTTQGFETTESIHCVFVPLVGRQGWAEGC